MNYLITYDIRIQNVRPLLLFKHTERNNVINEITLPDLYLDVKKTLCFIIDMKQNQTCILRFQITVPY